MSQDYPHLKLLIGGEWTPKDGREHEPVMNPATGECIGVLPHASKADLDRALEQIRGELETRKDVYTYDALSWVLFRGGNQKDAEGASQKALAMHTPEPMFLYYAGVIAIAGGNEPGGKEMLTQALALNPEFSYPEARDAAERLGSAQSLTAVK